MESVSVKVVFNMRVVVVVVASMVHVELAERTKSVGFVDIEPMANGTQEPDDVQQALVLEYTLGCHTAMHI